MSYTEQAGRKLVPCGGFPVRRIAPGDLLLVASAGDPAADCRAPIICLFLLLRTLARHTGARVSKARASHTGGDAPKKRRDLLEGPEITFAEAVLDNGTFGTRTIRFETGRLAQQAQGAVAAYLDEETMLLSATSAGKHPREGFDFFPLTVDVEERSYAAGKIPGSFFRREGRPSTEAILVCRLIDRPLRPSFVDGLRNEVQIVVTVLSIAPGEFYDALAINAASLSTQISGLPFSGPIAGVRLALIPGHGEHADQWIAFPTVTQLEEAVFDLIVAGRVITDADGNEDVAIMMVEAEATEGSWNLIKGGATKPNEQVVAEGLEASKPFIKQLVAAQNVVANTAAKAIKEFPVFLPYSQETYDFVAGRAYDKLVPIYQIADKVERQNADDALKDARQGRAARGRRGRRASRRRDARVLGRLQVGHEGDRARPHPRRGRAHRRPRPRRHPSARRRGAGHPARPRLGDLPARRDPDPGCHHAEHAQDGAADRLAVAGDEQALHAPLQLPAVLDR